MTKLGKGESKRKLPGVISCCVEGSTYSTSDPKDILNAYHVTVFLSFVITDDVTFRECLMLLNDCAALNRHW